MKRYDLYITFIFLVKLIFLFLAITHLYFTIKHKTDSEMDKKVLYWKEKIEFIFIILMSCLLIYLFNPRSNRVVLIDNETKVLLFLFGIIVLITAKWNIFIKENQIFKYFQSIV